jgi:hypothetical protein
MAGSKSCLSGEDFYGMYDAQVQGLQRLGQYGVVVALVQL